MKFSALSTAAALVALVGQLPAASVKCFKGDARGPANHADTLASLLVAAGNAEAEGGYPKTGTYWLKTKIDNFKGGSDCVSWGIENISGHYKEIKTGLAVEGLIREWTDCPNGGKTEYKDGSLNGWRFIFHMDCTDEHKALKGN